MPRAIARLSSSSGDGQQRPAPTGSPLRSGKSREENPTLTAAHPSDTRQPDAEVLQYDRARRSSGKFTVIDSPGWRYTLVKPLSADGGCGTPVTRADPGRAAGPQKPARDPVFVTMARTVAWSPPPVTDSPDSRNVV